MESFHTRRRSNSSRSLIPGTVSTCRASISTIIWRIINWCGIRMASEPTGEQISVSVCSLSWYLCWKQVLGESTGKNSRMYQISLTSKAKQAVDLLKKEKEYTSRNSESRQARKETPDRRTKKFRNLLEWEREYSRSKDGLIGVFQAGPC